MASIASQLATVQSNLANTSNILNNLGSGVTALDTLIQSLEAASSGASSTLSAADQATLTQIITQSSALNQQALAVNTSAPNPPAPLSGS
jgi:hypothetical protein